MTKDSIHITGLPFFPGMAVGRLQKGNRGDIAGRILLISQREMSGYRTLPAGFIVVEAVPFSHTMIGLFGLGVPTVMISAEQAGRLKQDTQLMIDGTRGLITNDLTAALTSIRPSDELLQNSNAGQAVLTTDGEPVNLLASVRQASVARQARELGAKAIGLVRTEFLLPEHERVPDKSFYRRAFRDICEAAAPLSVTFRLLDVASDKIPPWMAGKGIIGQALGMQGVRIYNIEPVAAVIEAQLEVLAELSNTFSIRVLLPFLARVEEYDYWLHLIRPRLPAAVSIGAMAETPAMVLDIGHLIGHADFVAIGCNDLMQSVFVADRDQAELRHYLDPYAPLLYRLFSQVAEQAGEGLNQVHLCGVLAQMQGVLPVLLGLGYRNFSVDAPFIPHLAKRISTISKADCEKLASQVIAADTTQQVLELLRLSTDRHAPYLC
jgi:phosphoenolpyruvate-protein kinase (PTS system EI component)